MSIVVEYLVYFDSSKLEINRVRGFSSVIINHTATVSSYPNYSIESSNFCVLILISGVILTITNPSFG